MPDSISLALTRATSAFNTSGLPSEPRHLLANGLQVNPVTPGDPMAGLFIKTRLNTVYSKEARAALFNDAIENTRYTNNRREAPFNVPFRMIPGLPAGVGYSDFPFVLLENGDIFTEEFRPAIGFAGEAKHVAHIHDFIRLKEVDAAKHPALAAFLQRLEVENGTRPATAITGTVSGAVREAQNAADPWRGTPVDTKTLHSKGRALLQVALHLNSQMAKNTSWVEGVRQLKVGQPVTLDLPSGGKAVMQKTAPNQLRVSLINSDNQPTLSHDFKLDGNGRLQIPPKSAAR